MENRVDFLYRVDSQLFFEIMNWRSEERNPPKHITSIIFDIYFNI